MKMEKIKGMAMAMIPVALGVAAGMLLYDQAKKATAGTMSSAVGGTRLTKVSTKFANSACSNGTKISVVCGETCPTGWTKVSGSHDRC
jgi:hypothetical protein